MIFKLCNCGHSALLLLFVLVTCIYLISIHNWSSNTFSNLSFKLPHHPSTQVIILFSYIFFHHLAVCSTVYLFDDLNFIATLNSHYPNYDLFLAWTLELSRFKSWIHELFTVIVVAVVFTWPSYSVLLQF